MENRLLDVGQLRHPMELRLLGICILGSLALILVLLLLTFLREPIMAASLSDEEVVDFLESLPPLAFIWVPVGLFLLIVWSTGRGYGKLRANAVRITEQQFPEVYRIWGGVTQDLGIKEVPDLYTINGNGLLNAYASCVPGFRTFSAVYSGCSGDLRAERGLGQPQVYLCGHEAGHIRLHHVKWWYLMSTFISRLSLLDYIIGRPLSRAREYGCDKVGHALMEDHDCKGLLTLTALKVQQLGPCGTHRGNCGAGRAVADSYKLSGRPSNTRLESERYPQRAQRRHLSTQEIKRLRAGFDCAGLTRLSCCLQRLV